MTRKIHKAHVALTTEGAVVVNVAGFVPTNIKSLIDRALDLDDDAERFIGIVLEEEEREMLSARIHSAPAETLVTLYGKRGGS